MIGKLTGRMCMCRGIKLVAVGDAADNANNDFNCTANSWRSRNIKLDAYHNEWPVFIVVLLSQTVD